MLFRKQKKSRGIFSTKGKSVPAAEGAPGLHLIEFDMMLKGSLYTRPTGQVRQFGVTVRGATHLVTSGDVVDDPTYRALVEAGVIAAEKDDDAAEPDTLRVVGEDEGPMRETA